MSEIRIASTEPPFCSPQLARRAVRVLAAADAMGLLEGLVIRRLDRQTLALVVERLAQQGIGREAAAGLRDSAGPVDYDRLLIRLNDALELSAVPDREWETVSELFEVDALAELLKIAPASVRRYRSKQRETPDDVAARLHYLAGVLGDLAGAYNEYGIRRWFHRARAQLDDCAPAELLGPGWSPVDAGPRKVRELARSLTGSGAT